MIFGMIAPFVSKQAAQAATTTKWATFKYDDFGDPNLGNVLALNGSASVVTDPLVSSGPVLRLTSTQNGYDGFYNTPGSPGSYGSVFSKQRIYNQNNYSFSTYFSFRFTGQGFATGFNNPTYNPSLLAGADGITFTIQTVQSNVGSPGGGMGYYGITPSFAVKFDTYKNPELSDPSDSYVGLAQNGSLTNTSGRYNNLLSTLGYKLKDGSVYDVWIDYDGTSKNIKVYMNKNSNDRTAATKVLDVNNINLGTIFTNQPSVYAGFTASTGGAWENHDILNWYFTNKLDSIDTDTYTYMQAPATTTVSTTALTQNGKTQLTATARDAGGNPVAGVPVTFKPDSGTIEDVSGNPVTLPVVTDANGEATVILNMGSTPVSSPGNVNAISEGGSYGTVAIPSSPTSLTRSNVTDTGATLIWTAVSGATSYKLYENGTLLTTVTGTTYGLTGLTPDISRDYTVTAVANNVQSAPSTPVSVTTLLSTPPALTADASNNDTAHAIDITFTDIPAWRGVVSAVYDGGTPLASSQYTLSAGKITINAGVLGVGNHNIIVKAAGYADANVTQPINAAATPPSVPTNLSASNTTETGTTLTWDTVTGATYYNVYMNGTFIAKVTSGTSYSVTNLSSATAYNFTVSAANADGESAKSTPVNVTTLAPKAAPSVPANLIASNTTETGTTLTWDTVTGATYYNVYMNGTFIAKVTSGTSYTVTNLSPATAYSFTVSAANADGESAKSQAVNVTTTGLAVEGLLSDQGDQVLSVGDTLQLTAKAVYSDQSIRKVDDGVTYSSSDPSVATVDSNGVITAKAPGTVTITVSFGGKSYSVTITVQSGEPQITLQLEATPESVVGDGKSQLKLKASVASLSGSPVAGVTIAFQGIGNSAKSAVTDANGIAEAVFTAPAIESIVPVHQMVTATATDPATGLLAQRSISVNFMPASVKGVLIDKVTGKPIAGAIVSVLADFDGDGTADFSQEVVTGADGSYQINVPRGNWNYTLNIQTPVQIGGQTVWMNTTQTAHVGALNGVGDEIASENKISGKLSVASAGSNGATTVENLFGAGNVSVAVKSKDGSGFDRQVTINSDGSFNVDGVPQGQYVLAYRIKAPDGSLLAGPAATVTINQNGEVSIVYSLIDPYGIVTDSSNGRPISDIDMRLYWADTELNRQNKRTPHTLVNLPELPKFAPNQNHNPQMTDASGAYAWMVYGDADYYIVASKGGYSTYSTLEARPTVPAEAGSDSYIQDGIIHVGQSLVSLNFSMKPKKSGSSGSSGSSSASGGNSASAPANLSSGSVTQTGVTLTWDAAAENATYNVYDNGKLIASGIAGTSYKAEGLAAGTSHSFTVTAIINGVESAPSDAVKVTMPEEADKSKQGKHEKYIEGYPDGTFKPDRDISRREIAAILSRILHLAAPASEESGYSDVTESDWGLRFIAAVTKQGIMLGYPDGTFRPDQPITREELASVAARVKGLKSSGKDSFTDTADSWARNEIAAVEAANVMNGYPDGSFRPKDNTTRAETVTIMNRIMERGPLTGITVPTWADVNPSHWAFADIEEASVDHQYITENGVEKRTGETRE
ncbi:S-layer homology domain-containing protein [Paenibacillus hamazuiensis]|uniref:S-layer homology domain-containing protein n=1 Tax=Paenibacillus hamazuiensis TaxID=2936508 RepID=UPI00200DAA54|nr:S-layer homology domain-containing protein [Paenibacillus hamazuiensis]